jgi:hypothetical protein
MFWRATCWAVRQDHQTPDSRHPMQGNLELILVRPVKNAECRPFSQLEFASRVSEASPHAAATAVAASMARSRRRRQTSVWPWSVRQPWLRAVAQALQTKGPIVSNTICSTRLKAV